MYTGVVHEESGQNGGTRRMLAETFPERGLDFDAWYLRKPQASACIWDTEEG